jgi:hypothetical protein
VTGNTPVLDVHSKALPKPLVDAIAARPREYDIEVGADRVLVGTDAPCDRGEENPLGMLEQLAGPTNQQRDMIRGLNALELLGEGQS